MCKQGKYPFTSHLWTRLVSGKQIDQIHYNPGIFFVTNLENTIRTLINKGFTFLQDKTEFLFLQVALVLRPIRKLQFRQLLRLHLSRTRMNPLPHQPHSVQLLRLSITAIKIHPPLLHRPPLLHLFIYVINTAVQPPQQLLHPLHTLLNVTNTIFQIYHQLQQILKQLLLVHIL